MTILNFDVSIRTRLNTLTQEQKNSWQLKTPSSNEVLSVIQKQKFQNILSSQLQKLNPATKCDLIYQAAMQNLHEAGIFLSFLFLFEDLSLTKDKDHLQYANAVLKNTTANTKENFEKLFDSFRYNSIDNTTRVC